MFYINATRKALKFCFEAHKKQADKGGLPYVFHPFHLAEQMHNEGSTVTALLHDVGKIPTTQFRICAQWALTIK